MRGASERVAGMASGLAWNLCPPHVGNWDRVTGMGSWGMEHQENGVAHRWAHVWTSGG